VTHALYLLDPEPGPAWAPFAGARPLSELRAGAHLVRERWERFAGTPAREIFALPHLAGFTEAGVPPVVARHSVTGPALIASSTFAPRGLAPRWPDGSFRLTADGVTVGWGIGSGAHWEAPQSGATSVAVSGMVLHGVFDLVRALELLLPEDAAALLTAEDRTPPKDAIVLGDPTLVALETAGSVEPGVVFDTRPGPIVLAKDVEVRAGARLEGPLWIGSRSRVLGGLVRGSAIGPRSVVRGELVSSVFLGFANKAHDGFVGHSVVGRWANFGAGTTTSNLKNTYGPVRLHLDGAVIETGLVNLGSLIGDHAKTAVGTLFATGSVVGTGANVFDAVRPPKHVAPFAWGGTADARMSRAGFLTAAGRVLARRDVALDEGLEAVLGRVYDWTCL
jgi:UDP-N-acetylglucosamine diphosphorylase/glucosamine-1-phosphate N-acetyltransferase